MNNFLEDSLQADLDLLKATEKANKAIIAHFNLLEHPYRGGPDFRFFIQPIRSRKRLPNASY
jgi:hypothetical protein